MRILILVCLFPIWAFAQLPTKTLELMPATKRNITYVGPVLPGLGKSTSGYTLFQDEKEPQQGRNNTVFCEVHRNLLYNLRHDK